jgi:hypothetical protein
VNILLRPLCWLFGHMPYATVVQFWSAGGGLPKAETRGRCCVLCDAFWPATEEEPNGNDS